MACRMNYFIIIGGSQSQVPFIKAAKKLGYNTVVFDQNPCCPGAREGDSFYPVSTHDFDSILKVCSELKQGNIIKGVITYSAYSEPLLAVAKLCQIFNLPSFSVESAELSIDKSKMKERFNACGIPTPVSLGANSFRETKQFLSEQPLPWILKPGSGSQGSLGVSIVDKNDKLEQCYNAASEISKDGSVIIDKYYNGREFSVDGIINYGEPVVFAVSEKFNLGYENNFTISGFAMGLISDEDHDLKKNIDSIRTVALDAVRSLEIDNSFFSVDVILSDEGPLVLECGILLDAKIDRFLHYAGINVYEMICRVATGERLEEASPKFQKGYALKFMFAPKEGKLKIVSGYDTQMSRNILIEWERNNGDLVIKPKSIADTVGWSITDGNDQKNAYFTASEIFKGPLFHVI